jgi:hypothetical protein
VGFSPGARFQYELIPRLPTWGRRQRARLAGYQSTDASKKEIDMSNDSNRDDRQISPSELQASDFFPPGHGWNKDEDPACKPRGPNAEVDDQDVTGAVHPRPN